MLHILPYTSALRSLWDDAVRRAFNRGATFLHLREFMDYHADRFTDASLLLMDEGENVRAVLPANRVEHTVCSHGGLTYGGLLTIPDVRAAEVCEMWKTIVVYWKQQGVQRFFYKPTPYIYKGIPSEEDLYALHQQGAHLTERTISSTIDLSADPLRYPKRLRSMRKFREALSIQYESENTEAWKALWPLLAANLQQRHGIKPVHTVEEILLLRERFPQEIQLLTARADGEVVAGIVVFYTRYVCHTQYMCASSEGRSLRALDWLIHTLVEEERALGLRRYFDFGISTEQGGAVLNEGLIAQKEGFGARGVCYDVYELVL